MPDNRVFRLFFRFYFRYIMPFIGGLVTGDRGAYLYLNRSVKTFGSAKDNKAMLEQAGFRAWAIPLACGAVWIYQAEKTSRQGG
jgi:demethylmenaquinone methyltransferase/2-methoxy-6-polyprenyl-1,4-benzoquinol methylase